MEPLVPLLADVDVGKPEKLVTQHEYVELVVKDFPIVRSFNVVSDIQVDFLSRSSCPISPIRLFFEPSATA